MGRLELWPGLGGRLTSVLFRSLQRLDKSRDSQDSNLAPGLEVCKEQGHRIVVVLGHPHFYQRFGFSSKLASALASPFGGGDSWMALELVAGALAGVGGRVEYPPPFEPVPEVRPVRNGDHVEWLRMRALLWPDCPAQQHAAEIRAFFDTDSPGWSEPFLSVATFVAVRPSGGLCGFLEASIRPYAEDCQTWPVGHVEGWFVDADIRRQGIGGRLMAAAEQWATAQGCREMASDSQVENEVSVEAHKALGFKESSRAVHFRKRLTVASGKTADRSCTTGQLALLVLDDTFAVCRLGSDASVPPWAIADGDGTARSAPGVDRRAGRPPVLPGGWRKRSGGG